MKISKTCLFWFWLYLIMINFQVFDTVKLAFCYLGSVYFIYPFESRMPWGYYWIYVIICVCPKYSSIMPQIGSRRIQGNSRSMYIMIHFYFFEMFFLISINIFIYRMTIHRNDFDRYNLIFPRTFNISNGRRHFKIISLLLFFVMR